MHPAARHLALHGAIVLLYGVLLGAPYARAINRQAPAHIVNAWRIAHQSLPIAAGLMLAVAGVLSHLTVGAPVLWLIAILLIASNYAFCVSMPLAAITGHRGLAPGGTGLQRVVFLGNVAGAWLSVGACVVLLYAAAVSL
jgi:hypothetical protein